MSHRVISVEKLAKAYRIGLKEEIPDTLVGAATSWLKAPLRNFHRLRKLNTFSANGDEEEDIIWALRNVSFDVAEGEVLGIIGRNGAGKSTLLKILSRITEPTQGRAVIHGRVSSLLEVGTGFHPELSGRENIYMNGTILGMRKKEIDRKLDEIIDFSGVEKFLDTPIKRYSSGMKIRLAFSVAAHLEPEILIIDEVLSVGDAEFQTKCLGKMQDVASGGRTVLFVSHNLAAVRSLCTRAVLLVKGNLTEDAPTDAVIEGYLRSVRQVDFHLPLASRTDDRMGTGEVRLTSVELNGCNGPTTEIPIGSECTFCIHYLAEGSQSGCNFGIHIRNLMDQVLLRITTLDIVGNTPTVDGEGVLRCTIPQLPLLPGRYQVALFVKRGELPGLLDHIKTALEFEVVADDVNGTGRLPKLGVCWVRAKWELQPESSAADVVAAVRN